MALRLDRVLTGPVEESGVDRILGQAEGVSPYNESLILRFIRGAIFAGDPTL